MKTAIIAVKVRKDIDMSKLNVEYRAEELDWKEIKPTDKDIFAFGAYLTGHDVETIKQMYKDWKR